MPEYTIFQEWPGVYVVKQRFGGVNSSFYNVVYRTDTVQSAIDYVNQAPWPKQYDLAGNLLA